MSSDLPPPPPSMVYHRTTAASAAAILRDGFRDSTDTYMTVHEYTGVWVSDSPLDVNEGIHGDTLLAVTLSPEAIAKFPEYEWVEEEKPYREWLVPAELLNTKASVRVIEEE